MSLFQKMENFNAVKETVQKEDLNKEIQKQQGKVMQGYNVTIGGLKEMGNGQEVAEVLEDLKPL